MSSLHCRIKSAYNVIPNYVEVENKWGSQVILQSDEQIAFPDRILLITTVESVFNIDNVGFIKKMSSIPVLWDASSVCP